MKAVIAASTFERAASMLAALPAPLAVSTASAAAPSPRSVRKFNNVSNRSLSSETSSTPVGSPDSPLMRLNRLSNRSYQQILGVNVAASLEESFGDRAILLRVDCHFHLLAGAYNLTGEDEGARGAHPTSVRRYDLPYRSGHGLRANYLYERPAHERSLIRS
ncbi:hypothetical protein ACDY96_23640 [Rhizobium mongolense]